MDKPESQHLKKPAESVSILIILSGPRRGYTKTLENDAYHLVIDFDKALHYLGPDDERAQNAFASLHRTDHTYQIKIPHNHEVWVNGLKKTESHILKSGDLLELGHNGVILRYRTYPVNIIPRKTIGMVMADCVNGANADANTKLGKISKFVTNFSWDIATQTTLWFRFWILVILTVLVISIYLLVKQNLDLQKNIATEYSRIELIEKSLEEHGTRRLSREELLRLQTEVENHLADTLNRLEKLEAEPGKASQVIASVTPSVVFLLGSYGFKDTNTGQLLHYVEATDGLITRYTLEEEGMVLEVAFTGTAIAASQTGLLLTNRHVIEPWKEQPVTTFTQGRVLEPVILKIIAYYPGVHSPVPVKIVNQDENSDLALLQSNEPVESINPLDFDPRVPQPGDEVILLGYPTGLRALVARADTGFLESITGDGAVETWTVAQQLAEAGYIKPLASRGIVSQVTDKFIVYDAETTFGGSGGPVINLNGRVIAINAAIIPEFGGSNMGVPAHRALYFLAQEHK